MSQLDYQRASANSAVRDLRACRSPACTVPHNQLLPRCAHAADAAAPSFSLQAPSGLSSDEEDEADSAAVTSSSSSRQRQRRSSLGGVRPLAPAELALAEVTVRLGAQLRLGAEKTVAAFERALADIDAQEAAALAAVAAQRAAQQQALAAAEEAAAAQRAAQRTQLLTGLRSQHQQKAAEGERQVQQLEAAMKQQQQAAAAAAAAAAKAAADKQAAAEAVAAAERQRQQQEAVQQAAADQAATDAAAAAVTQRKQVAATAAVQASGLRIAPSAAEWEKQCAEALAAAQVRSVEWLGGWFAAAHCLACPFVKHTWALVACCQHSFHPTPPCPCLPCPVPALPRAFPALRRHPSSRLWTTARCATRSGPSTSL